MTEEVQKVFNNILKIQENIDDIKNKYEDDSEFKDKINTVCYDTIFKGKYSIEEYFKDQIDTDRNIRLGIVGRVKAGKSSLLNSLLFEGKDILPEAPTPMTAALTQIEYSNDKNYIEIEFITEDDIKLLEEQDKQYKKLFEKVKNDLSVNLEIDEASLNKKTEDKIKSDESNVILIASSKIYNNIINIKNTDNERYREIIQNNIKQIPFSNIDEIQNELKDYVASDGKYVDFVKSLKLYINMDILKEISILDTPGFNDPLVTRNNKANQLLSKCDAILILTPSTHNFSYSDIEAMNRITKKEGIQEIYIVVSKFDDALVANSIAENSKGDLDDAIKNVLNDLYDNIENNLESINKNGVFDRILNNIENRVTYSSGICASMAETFEYKNEWSSEKNTVFKNLSEKYTDYFSGENTSKNNLEKLGNIKQINKILKLVEQKKEDILKDNLIKLKNKYNADASSIIEAIKKYIDERKKNIFNEDIENKKLELKKLLEHSEKIKEKMNANYIEEIEKYIINKSEEIYHKLENLDKKLDDIIYENIKDIKVFIRYKHNANKIKIENELYNYSKQFSEAKIYYINIVELATLISNFIIELLKKEVPADTEIQDFSIKSIIFDKFGEYDNTFQLNEEEKDKLFKEYDKKMKLDGKDAEIFISRLNTILMDYKKQASSKIKEKIGNLKKDLKNIRFPDLILNKYIDKLNNEMKELGQKEEALKKWNNILKEIMNII
ncbi:dynamin family protein [Brachyspira pulli]|uniref:dynamin family protein n=1 Tax=Brachyspira pulli TaxID=310721 RepID=UPI003005BF59